MLKKQYLMWVSRECQTSIIQDQVELLVRVLQLHIQKTEA